MKGCASVHLQAAQVLIAAHPSDGRDLEKGREPSTRFLDGKAGANIRAVELERLV